VKFYGILGVANNLIESYEYLRNRYQRVVINAHNSNGYSSQWKKIQHGVPQGSAVRPLLFLMYIYDPS
jgi:hypothetical protein